jgi:hypothetical protein
MLLAQLHKRVDLVVEIPAFIWALKHKEVLK